MKKRLIISTIVLLLITVATIWFVKWHFFSAGNDVVFEISPGQTVSQIAKNLKEKKIIRRMWTAQRRWQIKISMWHIMVR